MAPTLSKIQKIVIGVAISSTVVDTRKRRKKRSLWAEEIYKQRKRFTPLTMIKVLRSKHFRTYLRMNEECFSQLLSMVRPFIQKQNTILREAVSAEERLIATFRFLSSGCSYTDLMFNTAISPQLLSQIIPETCIAIYKCLKDYIKMPSTTEEWIEVSSDFESKWNFNHCVGAIDGKHIAIKKPPDSGSLFYNYKKFFSVILLAVVNANYEFIYIHVGTNGCVSDSSVLQKTKFYEKLMEDGLNLPSPSTLTNSKITAPYVFVGDSAFALDKNIMKPFPLKNIAHDKRIFNYRLSRARRVVENAFGILSSRFRIFRRAISIDIDNVNTIVLVSCALHNYLSRNN
ncbi:unnamed protein product [Parnassius mnemosyne]|uniref:DDE Tnp4 domain-containing protein n=1 Tax=Parnassius mnemosyne TaxID=213953 RepID=A0AAV1LP70_9NEOP